MVVRGVPLNVRPQLSVCRPGLVWVAPHLLLRQQAGEGVTLHGPVQAWVLVSRARRLVLGEAESVQSEAACLVSEPAEFGWERQGPARAEPVRLSAVSAQVPRVVPEL